MPIYFPPGISNNSLTGPLGISQTTPISAIHVGNSIIDSEQGFIGRVDVDGTTTYGTRFNFTEHAFPNGFGEPRNDQVIRLGWNMGIGGIEISGETASGIEFEDYYRPDSNTRQMETHLTHYDINGIYTRWWTSFFNRDTSFTGVTSVHDTLSFNDRSSGVSYMQAKVNQILWGNAGSQCTQLYNFNNAPALSQLNSTNNAYIEMIRVNSSNLVTVDPSGAGTVISSGASPVTINGLVTFGNIVIPVNDSGTGLVITAHSSNQTGQLFRVSDATQANVYFSIEGAPSVGGTITLQAPTASTNGALFKLISGIKECYINCDQGGNFVFQQQTSGASLFLDYQSVLYFRGNGGIFTASTIDNAGNWTLHDGTTFIAGTVTGLQIGNATNQKIGFYGAPPVVQQTGGVKTAGASYTSNEQTMLQTIWNTLRSTGILS